MDRLSLPFKSFGATEAAAARHCLVGEAGVFGSGGPRAMACSRSRMAAVGEYVRTGLSGLPLSWSAAASLGGRWRRGRRGGGESLSLHRFWRSIWRVWSICRFSRRGGGWLEVRLEVPVRSIKQLDGRLLGDGLRPTRRTADRILGASLGTWKGGNGY